MAARLSSLLSPQRINLSVASTKRTAAINEVAKLLETDPNVANFQGFYNELLARERLDTTCLGNEVALPHARTEHVKQIVIAVGRSDAGVHFENSNQNVRLMFVLGTPKSNPGDYLMLVTLRRSEQVLALPAVQPARTRTPTEAELKLATQLVESIAGDFDPGEWHNEYRERLCTLVAAKLHGDKVKPLKQPKRAPSASLEDALRASLAGNKERKRA